MPTLKREKLLVGEDRLRACSIRQLAECTIFDCCSVRARVRGKLPRITGWQSVLPGVDVPNDHQE